MAVHSFRIQEGGIGMSFTKDIFNGLFFIDFSPAPSTQAANFGLDVGDCILGINSRRFTVDDELADVAALLRSTPRPMTLTVRKAERGRERQAQRDSSRDGSSRETSHDSSRSSRGSSRGDSRRGERQRSNSQCSDSQCSDSQRGKKQRSNSQRSDSRRGEKQRSNSQRSDSRRGDSQRGREKKGQRSSSRDAGRRRDGSSDGSRDSTEQSREIPMGQAAKPKRHSGKAARRSSGGPEEVVISPGSGKAEAWSDGEFAASDAARGPEKGLAQGSKGKRWTFGVIKVAERFSRVKKLGPEDEDRPASDNEGKEEGRPRKASLMASALKLSGLGSGPRATGQGLSGAGAWNRAEVARLDGGAAGGPTKRRDSSMRDSYGFRESIVDDPKAAGAAVVAGETPAAAPDADPVAMQRAARRVSHQQQLVRAEAEKQHLPWMKTLYADEADRADQARLRSALREHREGKARLAAAASAAAAGEDQPVRRPKLDAEEEAVLSRIRSSRKAQEHGSKGRTASLTAAQIQEQLAGASDGFDKAFLADMAARRRAAERQEKRAQLRAKQTTRADRSALGLGGDGGGNDTERDDAPDDWAQGPWAAGGAKSKGARSIMPWAAFTSSSSSPGTHKDKSSAGKSSRARDAHVEVAAAVVVDDSPHVLQAYEAAMAKAQLAKEKLDARRQHYPLALVPRPVAPTAVSGTSAGGGGGGDGSGGSLPTGYKAPRPSLPSAATLQVHADLAARELEKGRRRAAKEAAKAAAEEEARHASMFHRERSSPPSRAGRGGESKRGDGSRGAGAWGDDARGFGEPDRAYRADRARSSSQGPLRKGREGQRGRGASRGRDRADVESNRRRAKSGEPRRGDGHGEGAQAWERGRVAGSGAAGPLGAGARSSSRGRSSSGGRDGRRGEAAAAARITTRQGLREDPLVYTRSASGVHLADFDEPPSDEESHYYEARYRRERVDQGVKPLSTTVAAVADSILDFFS